MMAREPLHRAALRLSCCLMVSAAALTAPAWSAPPAAAPTAAQFARPSSMSDVVLSPSGKRLAMIVTDPTDGHRALAVLDLPPTAAARVVASYGDADVSSPFWVNDDRLVYRAFEPGVEIRDGMGGTFAVDHDGQRRVELIAFTRMSGAPTGTRIATRTLSYEWTVQGVAPGGNGNEIIVRQGVATATGEWTGGKMARLDTVTGELTSFFVGAPANSHSWVFDAKGEPRVVQVTKEGRDRLYLRSAGSAEWVRFSDLAANDPATMLPLYLEGDDQLIVRTQAGKDTAGLYVFNLKTRSLEADPLISVARYDVGGVQVDHGQSRVVAAELSLDHPRTVWFSPRMAAMQKAIDSALPGRDNHIICTYCETSAYYVVFSASDQNPGEYVMYDPAKRQLVPLGNTRPWISPATQGRRSFHWVKARDGLPVPVVVTHPAGSSADQALPAVVLVHGGPWVPGTNAAWHAEPQFLASLGYRVIEPNFRGTLGYGARHFTASWKQWGQTMQDDVADAVLWAVKQGLVDRSRVCIYGASYGGYAALMGPVKHPDLYRCAASLVGVTDIMLMFSSSQSDMTLDWKHYGMPQMVGDPDTDRQMLDANSPLRRVADIKVPVLLAQGLLDHRVPREHADDFASAARKAGVQVERINYNDEAHGFSRAKNQADFWQHLAAFLERSLKP